MCCRAMEKTCPKLFSSDVRRNSVKVWGHIDKFLPIAQQLQRGCSEFAHRSLVGFWRPFFNFFYITLYQCRRDICKIHRPMIIVVAKQQTQFLAMCPLCSLWCLFILKAMLPLNSCIYSSLPTPCSFNHCLVNVGCLAAAWSRYAM